MRNILKTFFSFLFDKEQESIKLNNKLSVLTEKLSRAKTSDNINSVMKSFIELSKTEVIDKSVLEEVRKTISMIYQNKTIEIAMNHNDYFKKVIDSLFSAYDLATALKNAKTLRNNFKTINSTYWSSLSRDLRVYFELKQKI